MQDFMKAVEAAQQLPEAPDSNSPIPDLLRGTNFEQTIRTIAPGTENKITGATEYNFNYQCARLQIGKELAGFVDGQAQFNDIDESNRLQEIMNKSLSGEAIISKKTETFLKDGTVVIWLEWLEPKEPPPKKDRGYLTTAELFAPELPSDEEDSETTPGDENDD
jgi:hypothetical protein